MLSRQSSLQEIKEVIKECLTSFYSQDDFLFKRNKGRGVCERCLVSRFAYYLQVKIDNYIVDCDFNSSFQGYIDSNGRAHITEMQGKMIQGRDGTIKGRFVDIIVHKRDFSSFNNDFICFEIKKWNNYNRDGAEKDLDNLRALTSTYDYLYGFHLTLGKAILKTKWSIFRNGNVIESNVRVF